MHYIYYMYIHYKYYMYTHLLENVLKKVFLCINYVKKKKKDGTDYSISSSLFNKKIWFKVFTRYRGLKGFMAAKI